MDTTQCVQLAQVTSFTSGFCCRFELSPDCDKLEMSLIISLFLSVLYDQKRAVIHNCTDLFPYAL